MKYIIPVLFFAILTQGIQRDWSIVNPNYIEVIPRIPAHKLEETKIVGGVEAKPHGLPFQVAVINDVEDFCGGSIIAKHVVLTAAHCLDTSGFVTIIAGAHNVQTQEPSQTEITSRHIIIHPKWNRRSLVNDIALIILPRVIDINNITTAIISLQNDPMELTRRKAIVSGWGRFSDFSSSLSPVLRYAAEKIMAQRDCNRFYGVITTSHVCTIGANGKGACRGDSGGPLTIHRDNKVLQVGIVSFGSTEGCEAGYPSVYTRVSPYINWINANIQINRQTRVSSEVYQ